MKIFEALEALTRTYLPEEQVNALKNAYVVARDAHEGQYRSSGEPYITHPVAVATILASMHLDHETLTAALLHDVIEDTPVTYEELEAQFGHTVAELVNGVSKLDKLKFRNRKEAEAENFRKMVMAMVQDVRVIFIKLADRTHNMRTLTSLRPDKQRRIAKETLEIYAPLAHRLGINQLKIELEELGFAAMHPTRYLIIKKAIESARKNRKEMIQRILLEIENKLKSVHIDAQIYAQEKTIYAIYLKMRLKEQRFHSIMDIFSFRVIVKDIDTCYRILGQMHNLYKPRIGGFKDYIAIPKANGYQSLHTTMIGPHGVPVEVLIRTPDMNEMADMGIAACWTYGKEKENQTQVQTTTQEKVRNWIQSLLELQQSSGNSFEFIESVKSDLFPRHIYVFTPKGRIVELPAGSTPVDLAYAVHTDIGNRCIGARVDKQPSSLSRVLSNGQTVEIIVSDKGTPNVEWLNFVVSSKARARIRQTLKKLKREDSIQLGHQLLSHSLLNHGCLLDDIPPAHIQSFLETLKINTFNDLLAEIGLGNVMSALVSQSLCSHESVKVGANRDKKLTIHGNDNVLISIAKCCYPLPNDTILGYVSPEKGLVIHRESCSNLQGIKQDTERLVPMQWGVDVSQCFTSELKVVLLGSTDIISKLISAISQENANILNIDRDEGDGHMYTIVLTLQVKNLAHLDAVITRVKHLHNIIAVERN